MTSLPFVRSFAPILVLLMAACGAAAQDLGTMDPKPLPPLEHPDDPKTPAKQLFGRKTEPTKTNKPRSVGYYTGGCLDGGVALPINGPTWQVMRLSRNRNWGHPAMVKTVEELSKKAHDLGWNGFLVGDMAQPRGGPMITGHWSHQVGLDADVWLMPMPDRELTPQEREEMLATNVVNDQWKDVRPDVWSDKYIALYKMLAADARVERVLANPAIKKALCRDVKGDRSWLHKIRPVVGHNYHFHLRISCQAGSPNCRAQTAPPKDEGCGKDLDAWFKRPLGEPKANPAAKPILMSGLPAACKAVLNAP